jgi:hypothetical protein
MYIISKTSRKLHLYNGQAPSWKARGSNPGKDKKYFFYILLTVHPEETVGF